MVEASEKRAMRLLVLVLLGLAVPAHAKVLNVEFKFTPYTGDTKADKVTTVAGTGRVFLNNVPIADQEVRREEVPVMFDEREIASAIWVPIQSLGPAVRQGKNTIRFEFEPRDPKAAYHAQLRWASVTDEVKEEQGPGTYKGTNQADTGVDDKPATGKVVLEREFSADFAPDQPWHHLPAVTALTPEDEKALAALVAERAAWLKPDFAQIYAELERRPGMNVAEIRSTKCLDAAYKAGLHLTPAKDLEFVTTGGPEVVIRSKEGPLYPPDPKVFQKLKGDEIQMCAAIALAHVYQPRLVVVRDGGTWRVVY